MPFDGNGNYNLPSPAYPAISGTIIASATRNSIDSDLASALSNCMTRDGQSPPTANIPMGGFKLTGLAAGTVAGDSVRFEQVFGVPRARVQHTVYQSIPDIAFTDVICNSKDFDIGNGYNTSTGEYTVPVTGYYRLTAIFTFTTGVPGSYYMSADLRKNGASLVTVSKTFDTAVGVAGTLTYADLLHLTAGDKLLYVMYQNSTASRSLFSVCTFAYEGA